MTIKKNHAFKYTAVDKESFKSINKYGKDRSEALTITIYT